VNDSSLGGLLVFGGAGIGILAMRWYADTSERGRDIARRLYLDQNRLLFVRAFVPVAPLIAASAFVFAIGAAVPNLAQAWLFIPAVILASIAFLMSYRVPPPLAPNWMREELDDGRLAPQRPGMADWILFWIVLPFIVLGPIAIAVLIVAFDAVQP
jgi:hypothetical protein